MSILAVDLAAKHSATVLMDDDYRVIWQRDSFGLTEDTFVYLLSSRWMRLDAPEAMIVEDLPHGLSYSTLVKTVCRLQGRIVQAMHETTDGDWNEMLFAAPQAWRAHYPEAKRGTGPTIVFEIAAKFGYQPPESIGERTKGKGGPSLARKIASDYCAAYLIGRWAIDMKKQHGTYDVPGTSRYDTKAIRQKDFDAQDL